MTSKGIKNAVVICKEMAIEHMRHRWYWMQYDRYEVDDFNAIHIYFTNHYRMCHYVFMANKGEWKIKTVAYG